MFLHQGLAIIGFNDENINSKKFLREVLSLGPTYVVMKFFESRFLSVDLVTVLLLTVLNT